MKIEYRRDIYHNYLILSGGQTPDPASYQVRMLLGNAIAGFLPCKIQQMDQNILFYYEITSRQPLQLLLEHRQVDREMLQMILTQLLEALENIRNYLLDLNGLRLKPELIYLDLADHRLWFCYYPGQEETFQQQLRELSEYLLPKLDHTDREAVMLGYLFYQKCTEEAVTAELLAELVHRAGLSRQEVPPEEAPPGEDKEAAAVRQEVLNSFFEPEAPGEKGEWNPRRVLFYAGIMAGLAGIPAGICLQGKLRLPCFAAAGAAGLLLLLSLLGKARREAREGEEAMDRYLSMSREEEEKEVPRERPQEFAKEFPEEERRTDPDREEETICLAALNQEAGRWKEKARLIPLTDSPAISPAAREIISLDKHSYLLGKQRSYVDIQLHSPAVSRIHARLTWNGETYCLQDINSKNGTYLNQVPLEAGHQFPLHPGDQIRFADLTYTFQW